eukprot:1716220-Lingulodinium_polyedra.AAC.1
MPFWPALPARRESSMGLKGVPSWRSLGSRPRASAWKDQRNHSKTGAKVHQPRQPQAQRALLRVVTKRRRTWVTMLYA